MVGRVGVIDGGAAIACAAVVLTTQLIAVTRDWDMPTVGDLTSNDE